jgi:hypothetical protein
MLRHGNVYTQERERALADGIREVASDLRLIDVADLVAYIRTGQFGNIESLVSSSTELYFKPSTISFGNSGAVRLNWDPAAAGGAARGRGDRLRHLRGRLVGP